MTRKEVWYWDSCVLLGVLKKETDKIHVLSRLLYEADAGGAQIVLSAWSLFEVINLGSSTDEKSERVIRDFLRRSCFRVVNLDRRIAESGRELMWLHKKAGISISPKDAPHLATAAMFNVDVLHTYDPILLSLDRKIKRQDGRDLWISVPNLDQEPLALNAVN